MNNLLNTFEKQNKTYFNKLKFEVKSLELLTRTILSEIEKTKTCQLLEGSQNISRLVITNSSTIIATEEVYDTVNRYLKALIQYVDSTEDGSHYVLPAIISGPQFCHLPTLCNMLWRRIQTQSKAKFESKVSPTASSKETDPVSMSFKSSQTDVCSLVYCESCCLSTELIKSLVHLILELQKVHNVEETNISKAREKIRNEVYEMSQLGVMREWTDAIRDDIEWLLSLTVSALRKCDKMSMKQDVEMQEHRRRETVLQNDLDMTRKLLEAEQAHSVYLKQQIETLNTAMARRIKKEKALSEDIHKYRNKLKSFGRSFKLIKDDCNQIKECQEALEAFVKSKMLSTSRTFQYLKDDIAYNIKKNDNNYSEALQREKEKLREAQEISNKKDHEIAELKTNVLEHYEEKQELRERLDIMTNEMNTKETEMQKVKEMVIKLEELFEESKRREELSKSQEKSLDAQNLKISGDPLTDMENQRQVNKRKIKILLRENANLKTTISKLNQMRPDDFESSGSLIS